MYNNNNNNNNNNNKGPDETDKAQRGSRFIAIFFL